MYCIVSAMMHVIKRINTKSSCPNVSVHSSNGDGVVSGTGVGPWRTQIEGVCWRCRYGYYCKNLLNSNLCSMAQNHSITFGNVFVEGGRVYFALMQLSLSPVA